MKKIYLLSFLMTVFFGAWQVSAQCIASTSYGSGTLNQSNTTPVVFQNCYFADEYAPVQINESGEYIFTSTVGGDYLTLTTATNTVVAHGATPLLVDVTSTGGYRLHVFSSAACGTSGSCRALSGVANVPPPSAGCGDTGSFCYGNSSSYSSILYTIEGDSPTDEVTIEFTAGVIENNWDFLRVYEGTDSTGTILLNGHTGPIAGVTVTGVGALAISVQSDGSFSCATGEITPAVEFVVSCSAAPIGNAPQIICPNNITVLSSNYPQDDCGAQVFFNDAQASDPEDGLLPVTQTMGLASGSVFPIGEHIIEFSTTDSDGNVSTCQFTVTVVDDIDPVAACQNYTIALDENGIATLDAEMLNQGYGFSCTYSVGLYDTYGDTWNGGTIDVLVDGEVVLEDLTNSLGTLFDPQPNVPEWFNFEVMPGQSIEILYTAGSFSYENWFEVSDGPNGTGDVIYNTPTGQTPDASHNVDNLCESGDGSSDLCGDVFFSFDEDGLITSIDMECMDLGENMVTLYITDEGGNQVTCDVLVFVEDNIAPEIVCLSGGSGSIMEDFDSGLPAGWQTVVNTGTCNWQPGNLPVTWTGGDYTFPTPAMFFNDDACGSGQPASNASLISDVYSLGIATSISLTYDVAYRHLGSSSLVVEVFDGNDWQNVATYNTNTPVTTAGPFDVSVYANNNFQVRFVYDDGNGWTWGASIDNFLLEYEAPDDSVPQYFLDANGEVAVPITDLYDSVSDNCSVTVTVDGSGADSCSQSVPSNNIENGGFFGGATNQSLAVDVDVDVDVTFIINNMDINVAGEATTFDIILREDDGGLPGVEIMTLSDVDIVGEEIIGSNFGFDFYTYSLEIGGAIELEGGATGAKYWLQVNTDAVAWESTSASSQGLSGAFNNDDTLGDWFIGTTEYIYELNGVCSVEGENEVVFTCADVGMTTVTVTATDAAGNSTSCTSTVEIIDNIPPVLVTQDIVVELDENGQAMVSYEDFYAYSPDDYYVVTIGGDNGSFEEGTTDLVVDVVEDVSVSFDWDYTNDDIFLGWDSFGYTVNGVYTQLTDPAIGNQSGSATVNLSAGDEFGFRSQTDDNAGGAGTTTITEFMPGFTGQFAPENWTEVLDNSDGSAEFVVIPGGVLAYDNCGITTGAVDITTFTCDDIGDPIEVTIFVSDASGNVASSTATVTVVDAMAPVIECLEDQTVFTDPEAITYAIPDYVAEELIMVTDNCTDPVTEITQTPAPGTLLLVGTHTVTITAMDEYGNESSCSFELTVEDELGQQEILKDAVVMYPNPADHIFYITNSSSIVLTELVMYDVAGKIVNKVDLSQMVGEQAVDVSELSSGVYMVRIQSETTSVVKRLIKK